MNNDFYVYIYWRLDTNEPFYIGMGHGDRWRWIWQRGAHFTNIINKHSVVVEIIKDNLTQEQALDIECWLINELVFEYGFSIDIPNNRSSEKGYHLVNCTWGGEGSSGINPFENKTEEEMEEIKRKISEGNKGRIFTDEHKRKLSESNKGKIVSEETKKKLKEVNKGEKHWNYGKHHSEETKKKMSENHADVSGKNNPNYGKGDRIRGKNNPGAKAVICLTTNTIFYTTKEGAEYYGITPSAITICCKGCRYSNGKEFKVKSAGKLPDGTLLKWMYLNKFLEKCKYILL